MLMRMVIPKTKLNTLHKVAVLLYCNRFYLQQRVARLNSAILRQSRIHNSYIKYAFKNS